MMSGEKSSPIGISMTFSRRPAGYWSALWRRRPSARRDHTWEMRFEKVFTLMGLI